MFRLVYLIGLSCGKLQASNLLIFQVFSKNWFVSVMAYYLPFFVPSVFVCTHTVNHPCSLIVCGISNLKNVVGKSVCVCWGGGGGEERERGDVCEIDIGNEKSLAKSAFDLQLAPPSNDRWIEISQLLHTSMLSSALKISMHDIALHSSFHFSRGDLTIQTYCRPCLHYSLFTVEIL